MKTPLSPSLDVKFVTYQRNPKKEEINFGYGANHYCDIEIKDALKRDGTLKKWLIKRADGLRWYRPN